MECDTNVHLHILIVFHNKCQCNSKIKYITMLFTTQMHYYHLIDIELYSLKCIIQLLKEKRTNHSSWKDDETKAWLPSPFHQTALEFCCIETLKRSGGFSRRALELGRRGVAIVEEWLWLWEIFYLVRLLVDVLSIFYILAIFFAKNRFNLNNHISTNKWNLKNPAP